jgi:hypothetical protein
MTRFRTSGCSLCVSCPLAFNTLRRFIVLYLYRTAYPGTSEGWRESREGQGAPPSALPWAGLCWAVLCWAGLGWAVGGLCCAGLGCGWARRRRRSGWLVGGRMATVAGGQYGVTTRAEPTASHGIGGYLSSHTTTGSRWESHASYALFFVFVACAYTTVL